MCYFVYIGVPARASSALVDALAGLRCQKVKYEAKGWSESKIRRALPDVRPETPSQYARFHDAIAAFVGSTGSLRILAHWDKGRRETVTPRHGTMSLADYIAREGTYDPEVLYDLRPDAPAGSEREGGR